MQNEERINVLETHISSHYLLWQHNPYGQYSVCANVAKDLNTV